MCVRIKVKHVRRSDPMMGYVFNAKMGIRCQGINASLQRNSMIDVISMKTKINAMSARIILWKRMDNVFCRINQPMVQQSLTLLLEEIIIMEYLGELEESTPKPQQLRPQQLLQLSQATVKSINPKTKINV